MTLQIRLGHHKDVDATTDGLGRSTIGAFPGMSEQDAWLAGRGVWKLNPANVLEQDELQIINLDGTVLAVGTITGISKAGGGRHAVEGDLKVGDPRVGKKTTTPHKSRNSVAYF